MALLRPSWLQHFLLDNLTTLLPVATRNFDLHQQS